VDAVEPQVRVLLAEFPRMPSTMIAERIGWTRSLTILKDRVRELRPLFLPPDPADRLEYTPGELAQCDLWFPPVPIPVSDGTQHDGQRGGRVLPVLAMTCGYSRVTDAVMIPSRKAGDILTGMWEIIGGWGRCPRTLVWDREAAIGGSGKPSIEAAAFAGTLGVRIKLTPPRATGRGYPLRGIQALSRDAYPCPPTPRRRPGREGSVGPRRLWFRAWPGGRFGCVGVAEAATGRVALTRRTDATPPGHAAAVRAPRRR
jgi:Integrase core domain